MLKDELVSSSSPSAPLGARMGRRSLGGELRRNAQRNPGNFPPTMKAFTAISLTAVIFKWSVVISPLYAIGIRQFWPLIFIPVTFIVRNRVYMSFFRGDRLFRLWRQLLWERTGHTEEKERVFITAETRIPELPRNYIDTAYCVPNGNTILAGNFSDTVDFGCGSLTGPSGSDTFLVEFAP